MSAVPQTVAVVASAWLHIEGAPLPQPGPLCLLAWLMHFCDLGAVN